LAFWAGPALRGTMMFLTLNGEQQGITRLKHVPG
jgi:hypothetical protein